MSELLEHRTRGQVGIVCYRYRLCIFLFLLRNFDSEFDGSETHF